MEKPEGLVGPSTVVAGASTTGGGRPMIERQRYVDYLARDDFFIDLCGIVSNTTVRETDILKTWPDGSQTFHVERSFIPDDPRLPIERGAETSYFAPDGTMTAITGKPIQLIGPTDGIRAQVRATSERRALNRDSRSAVGRVQTQQRLTFNGEQPRLFRGRAASDQPYAVDVWG
ncbi:MAG: hypothetical protein ACTHKS_10020 [Gaiellaceae bacterium]